jgi:glutathione peroxidase
MSSVLDHTLPRLDGTEEKLDKYRGQVVLVVNTASECGLTPQFEGLEKLYNEKKDDGFVILGFPANDFADQEPLDDSGIASFCQKNFGVTFPMFSKSSVLADPVNPVFAQLNEAVGAPTWNFTKVLLDREGEPLRSFEPQMLPDDAELVGAIDAELART